MVRVNTVREQLLQIIFGDSENWKEENKIIESDESLKYLNTIYLFLRNLSSDNNIETKPTSYEFMKALDKFFMVNIDIKSLVSSYPNSPFIKFVQSVEPFFRYEEDCNPINEDGKNSSVIDQCNKAFLESKLDFLDEVIGENIKNFTDDKEVRNDDLLELKRSILNKAHEVHDVKDKLSLIKLFQLLSSDSKNVENFKFKNENLNFFLRFYADFKLTRNNQSLKSMNEFIRLFNTDKFHEYLTNFNSDNLEIKLPKDVQAKSDANDIKNTDDFDEDDLGNEISLPGVNEPPSPDEEVVENGLGVDKINKDKKSKKTSSSESENPAPLFRTSQNNVLSNSLVSINLPKNTQDILKSIKDIVRTVSSKNFKPEDYFPKDDYESKAKRKILSDYYEANQFARGDYISDGTFMTDYEKLTDQQKNYVKDILLNDNETSNNNLQNVSRFKNLFLKETDSSRMIFKPWLRNFVQSRDLLYTRVTNFKPEAFTQQLNEAVSKVQKRGMFRGISYYKLSENKKTITRDKLKITIQDEENVNKSAGLTFSIDDKNTKFVKNLYPQSKTYNNIVRSVIAAIKFSGATGCNVLSKDPQEALFLAFNFRRAGLKPNLPETNEFTDDFKKIFQCISELQSEKFVQLVNEIAELENIDILHNDLMKNQDLTVEDFVKLYIIESRYFGIKNIPNLDECLLKTNAQVSEFTSKPRDSTDSKPKP